MGVIDQLDVQYIIATVKLKTVSQDCGLGSFLFSVFFFYPFSDLYASFVIQSLFQMTFGFELVILLPSP